MIFLCPSSGDELQPPTERLLPPPSAGAHSCLPTHEDAQEDPGTPVVGVLRNLRPDGPPHLHSKKAVIFLVFFAFDGAGVCLDL